MSEQQEPTPVSALDIDLAASMLRTRRLQTATLAIVALLLLYVGVSTGFLLNKALNENTRIAAQIEHSAAGECQFFQELATVPVIANGTSKEPATSELGAKIVINSRNAFLDLGCGGDLGAPSHALVALSQKYGIPLGR